MNRQPSCNNTRRCPLSLFILYTTFALLTNIVCANNSTDASGGGAIAIYQSNEVDMLVARQFVGSSPPVQTNPIAAFLAIPGTATAPTTAFSPSAITTGTTTTTAVSAPVSAPFATLLQQPQQIPSAATTSTTTTQITTPTVVTTQKDDFKICSVCPIGHTMSRVLQRITSGTINFILIDLQCIDIERIAQRAEFSSTQCTTIHKSTIPSLCGCAIPAIRAPITYEPTSPPVPSAKPVIFSPTSTPNSELPSTRFPSITPSTTYPTMFGEVGSNGGGGNTPATRNKVSVTAIIKMEFLSVTGRMPDTTIKSLLVQLDTLLNEYLNNPSNPSVAQISSINANYLNQILNTQKVNPTSTTSDGSNNNNNNVRSRQLQSNATTASSSAMPLYPLDVYVQFYGWVDPSSTLRESPRLFPAEVMNTIETNQDTFIKTLKSLPGIIDPLFFRTTIDIVLSEAPDGINKSSNKLSGGIIALIVCLVLFVVACIIAATWLVYRLLQQKKQSNGSESSEDDNNEKKDSTLTSLRKKYLSLVSNPSDSSIQSDAPHPSTTTTRNTTTSPTPALLVFVKDASTSVRDFTVDTISKIKLSFGSSLLDPESGTANQDTGRGDPPGRKTNYRPVTTQTPVIEGNTLTSSTSAMFKNSFSRIKSSMVAITTGVGTSNDTTNKKNNGNNSVAVNTILQQGLDVDAAIDESESKQGEDVVSNISSARRPFFGSRLITKKRSGSNVVRQSDTSDTDKNSENNNDNVVKLTTSPPSIISDNKSLNENYSLSEQIPFYGYENETHNDAMSYTYSLETDNRTYMNYTTSSDGPGTVSASNEDTSTIDDDGKLSADDDKVDNTGRKSTVAVSLSSLVAAASSTHVANIFKSAFGGQRNNSNTSKEATEKGIVSGASKASEESSGGEEEDDSKDEIDKMYRNHERMISRTVLAPAGKLGIVIDTSIEGPIVHRVFPTSPLEGKVFVGDIITGIDDIDTRTMSAVAISELMIKTAFQPRTLTVLSEDNWGIKETAAATTTTPTTGR